jgi:hypothetical protein
MRRALALEAEKARRRKLASMKSDVERVSDSLRRGELGITDDEDVAKLFKERGFTVIEPGSVGGRRVDYHWQIKCEPISEKEVAEEILK